MNPPYPMLILSSGLARTKLIEALRKRGWNVDGGAATLMNMVICLEMGGGTVYPGDSGRIPDYHRYHVVTMVNSPQHMLSYLDRNRLNPIL